MKNFKDLVSEVAQPKAPEEKRFKDQHAIEVIGHPVALDHQFTGDIDGIESGKRIADKVDDEADYDQAYKKPKKVQTLPRESTLSYKKSITEILGVYKKDVKKDGEEQEEAVGASCGCGPDCDHCGGSHPINEIGKDCECCGNKIEGVASEGSCGSTLKAEKQPVKKAEIKKESDTEASATLEKQPKPKPSQVTIKDSNGKTISLTFKEMLEKVSTEDELLESPQQEIPMMMKQLHFICYASEEISDYLKMEGQDPEEWWQNKLAEVFSNVKSLYAYAKGDQMMNLKPISAARMFKASKVYEEIQAGSFELSNSETVEISEEDASILNIVFENLNETNSSEMYSVLVADKAGYNEILSFAKENV